MGSPIFLAAPRIGLAPPITAVTYSGLSGMRWEGWDGTVWDLLSPDGIFIAGAVRGLSMPPVERASSSSAALAGSRYRGHRVSEREVFWPLFVYSDVGSQEWAVYDRAFWRTMNPAKVGTWVVSHPDGTERRLRLRYTGDSSHAFESDPTKRGWELYGVTLVAEQPYWEGEKVVRSWKAALSVPFFGPAPTLFTISSASTAANATIDNEGDVEVWPTLRFTGTAAGASVGIDGRVVSVPFAVPAGQTLTIDTRPDRQTAIDWTGADRTRDISAANFAPIDPGVAVPLSINLTGAGIVEAEITPLYFRAW